MRPWSWVSHHHVELGVLGNVLSPCRLLYPCGVIISPRANPLVQLHPASLSCFLHLHIASVWAGREGWSEELSVCCVGTAFLHLSWLSVGVVALTGPEGCFCALHNWGELLVFIRCFSLHLPQKRVWHSSHHASMCAKSNKVTGLGDQRNFSFKARLATCLLTSLFMLSNQNLDSHSCYRGGKC